MTMLQLEPRELSSAREPRTMSDNDIRQVLRRAGKRIAPVWPLENFVAVNPYLGMTEMSIGQVAARMAKVAGARTFMPQSFYFELLETGRITQEDLRDALREHDHPQAGNCEAFLSRLTAGDATDTENVCVPTVADEARRLTGRDWQKLADERIAAWAAVYFDEGYALWPSADRRDSIFTSWKIEASIDRTPELLGLRDFRRCIQALPDDPVEAARLALEELGIADNARELYLHRLLLRVGGWSAFAARFVWEGAIRGEEDASLIEFQAVLLSWELALSRSLTHPGWPTAWTTARQTLAVAADDLDDPSAELDALILQTAFDLSEQRRTMRKLATQPANRSIGKRPDVQAVFCIDVRSEVFRRHFESAVANIETLGFAGFFGFPLAYRPIGHRQAKSQCPVLMTPQHTVLEALPDDSAQQRAIRGRTLKHHVGRAWYSFKMGAISCFSFVGPIGLAYLPRLFTDGFGLSRPVQRPENEGLTSHAVRNKGPRLEPEQHGDLPTGISFESRVRLAEGALRAMSLTRGFAPLVMITGHGSTTVNNPHGTGLDCGACGGNAGEANARVAAAVLNESQVREALRSRGIDIPADTVFLACQHDTTTDEVTIFNRHGVPASHAQRLQELEESLRQAARGARAERALRFEIGSRTRVDEAVIARSRDWSQVRPEWGLAGCAHFIVAPRSRTKNIDLRGRAFLHSYEWRQDPDFTVLESIMTAPMVVASWINLQYYGSTVENRLFGSGNKTLHNVVGKVGVLEGNAGDLRVGLPWQSVYDGRQLQHEPLRLSVIIEAPRHAVEQVIIKNEVVRDLVGNGWLFLTVVDDDQWYRWLTEGRWKKVSPIGTSMCSAPDQPTGQ